MQRGKGNHTKLPRKRRLEDGCKTVVRKGKNLPPVIKQYEGHKQPFALDLAATSAMNWALILHCPCASTCACLCG